MQGATSARRLVRPTLLMTVLALGVPVTVAFDSYLYVQSSRHVFTGHALEGYHWIREPLYPLIIKAVRVAAGNADFWLIWVQVLAMFLAALIVATALLPSRGRIAVVTALAIAANPMALGYAGSVLQTVWITLVLALNVGLVSWAWRTDPPPVARLLTAFAALTVVASYLSFQLGYLSFVTGFGVGIAIVLRGANEPLVRLRQRGPRAVRFLTVLSLGLALGLAGVVTSRVALLPWNAYKDSVTAGATTDELGLVNTVDNSPSAQLGAMLEDPAGAVAQVTQRSLQLIGMREPVAPENEIFGPTAFLPERRCGKLFWAETMPEPVADTAVALQPTCKSPVIHRAISLLTFPGNVLYWLSSLALLLAVPILLVLRRWVLILVIAPAYMLVFMYASIGAGIDRYGFPAYPVGVGIGVLLLIEAWNRTHRHGEPSAPDTETSPAVAEPATSP